MSENERRPPSERPIGPDKEKPLGEPISGDLATRVRNVAFTALAPGRRATSNLYLNPVPVPKGTRIGPSFASHLVEHDSILCFADHEPRAHFAHSCAYFLHDARSGELVRRVAAQFPPYPSKGIHRLALIHEPVKAPEILLRPLRLSTTSAVDAPPGLPGRRFAILFAGEADPSHLNDFELALRTLTDPAFGFAPGDIQVLFHNGLVGSDPWLDKHGNLRDWPGDGSTFNLKVKPFKKASRLGFQLALNQLAGQLTANDLVFIHTAGHGGNDEYGIGQFLYVFPEGPYGNQYSSAEMATDLQVLNGHKSLLVLMNQCFAGGFSNSIVNGSLAQQTFFAAACSAADLANATEDYNWSEFALHWYEAEMQHLIDRKAYMPGTDDDVDGRVEASEAYDYCVFINEKIKGLDTPVFARKPPPGPDGHSTADEISLT